MGLWSQAVKNNLLLKSICKVITLCFNAWIKEGNRIQYITFHCRFCQWRGTTCTISQLSYSAAWPSCEWLTSRATACAPCLTRSSVRTDWSECLPAGTSCRVCPSPPSAPRPQRRCASSTSATMPSRHCMRLRLSPGFGWVRLFFASWDKIAKREKIILVLFYSL